jgi:pyruvate,orthophosphate dikinase
MGKPCVAGAEGIHVDVSRRVAEIGEVIIEEGDVITIDGSSGNVFLGSIPMVEPDFTEELNRLLRWADEESRLKVMANADSPTDARRALKYGATGIGLCRTERMFNAVDRLPTVIEMIVAENAEEREAALDKLLPIQRDDFKELFEIMAPMPVTIRLLDPPIHEFLPTENQLEEDIARLSHLQQSVDGMSVLASSVMLLADPNEARQTSDYLRGMVDASLVTRAIEKKEQMLRKVRILTETNPMLGHRGVRLGITFPEIYAMQVRAILEAAADCTARGLNVSPRIMVPQVCTHEELRLVRKAVDQIHKEVEQASGQPVRFQFGTMIEVVRACMRAESLAGDADFFSFGTNDLTQATFSFSREDAENKFLPMYNRIGILKDNPFEVLDVKGVGKLMKLAVEWGRELKPNLDVSMVDIRNPSPSVMKQGSTMSPARRHACRSRDLPRPMRACARKAFSTIASRVIRGQSKNG